MQNCRAIPHYRGRRHGTARHRQAQRCPSRSRVDAGEKARGLHQHGKHLDRPQRCTRAVQGEAAEVKHVCGCTSDPHILSRNHAITQTAQVLKMKSLFVRSVRWWHTFVVGNQVAAVALAFALCACEDTGTGTGQPPLQPDKPARGIEFDNGARLAAERVETAQGVARMLGIFDTKEGVACGFVPAADKVLRCLPEGAFITYLGQFADPSCTASIFRVPVDLDVTKGAAIPLDDSGDCGNTLRFAVKLFAAHSGKHFEKRGESCVESDTRYYHPHDRLMVVSGERSAADWVAGESVVQQGAARIRMTEVRSADGGRFVTGFFDQELGARCERVARSADEPNLTCTPPGAVQTERYFADASCTARPLDVVFDRCARPTVVKLNSGEFVAVGGLWSQAAFGWDGSSCTPIPLDHSSFTFFEVPAPRRAISLGTLEAKRIGEGRLTMEFATIDGKPTGRPDLKPDAFDSKLGEACEFVLTPKDGARCFSDRGVLSTTSRVGPHFYSDAACSNEIVACEGNCEGREVALRTPRGLQLPLVDLHVLGRDAGDNYFKWEFDSVLSKEVCSGPHKVSDLRGLKDEAMPLQHLWFIGAPSPWDRFETVFLRNTL